MNGDDVPFVSAAGYKVNVPGDGLWLDAVGVHFDRGVRKVHCYVRDVRLALPYWGVPAPRELR